MNTPSSSRALVEGCVECGICVRECRYLQTCGPPGVMVRNGLGAEARSSVFECSLCGLCSKVCPKGLDPRAAFLDLRRNAVERGEGVFPEHATILAYERRGMSRRYTWYGLPEGCETVFFPGCGLSGTRSERVLQVYETLQSSEPSLGVVLDCCGKPSHDLGRSAYFHQALEGILSYLLAKGVRRVLVACPNCHRVFRDHGGELEVESVYERLAMDEQVGTGDLEGLVTIHDPCAVRSEAGVHEAARELVRRTGLSIREMEHSRERTVCCGQGASVPFLSPELADTWRQKRREESNGETLVTYCAGCAGYLGSMMPTSHLLDLVYEPRSALDGKAPVAKAPVTYWRRLRLKARLRHIVPASHQRERSFPERKASAIPLKITFATVLAAAVIGLHLSGVTGHFDQESLRAWIERRGLLAPALYVLLYAVAPSLLLPGLPLTIAGGILFGPFLGVLYTIIGSTTGACVAFLVARHLAGEWVRGKLRSPRWKRLDRAVERNGWKVVLLMRLVPVFPYNLLNYALGLTRVRFVQYAVATFFGMLPACVAFVVFSSSLLDLFRGNISAAFIMGLLLVATIFAIPVIHAKLRAKHATATPRAPLGTDP